MPVLYDTIGARYSTGRRTDPRVARALWSALGTAAPVLNVGAGTGSYEPRDRPVVAVEPSAVMIAQRPPDAPPAVRARAEALPFRSRTFAASMAVLTMHHWTDALEGLRECARVARERVVILTWTPDSDGFWLTRDYFPEIIATDRTRFPAISSVCSVLEDAEVRIVPVPADCVDGFLGAYWRRPAAYLDPGVRAGMSSFAHMSDAEPAFARLAADLASGAWVERHGDLLARDELDIGYRIVAGTPRDDGA